MFIDRTDELQRLLDSGDGRVVFPDGEHLVSRPLLIADRTSLVCSPRTHIKLADGANCPIIRNRDKGKEMTTGITIEGGVWDGNNLRQQRDLYDDEITRGFSSFWSETEIYPHLMGFAYVEDFTLKGVTIKDPEAFAVMLTAAERFTVKDIIFDFNLARPNMDGIHVNGFARDGYIANVKGETNDDLVALNGDEGSFACENCDIESIVIDGLYGGRNGYTAVRLLSHSARLKSIAIRNVFGAYRFNAVLFSHWARKPGSYGWFDSVLINGVFASSARKSGEGHGGLIWFEPGVHHAGTILIDNVVRIDEPDAFNTVHTIDVPDDVIIEHLEIGNVRQQIPDSKPPIRIADGAKIHRLESRSN